MRVIVDNKEIYPLETYDPILIEIKKDHTRIVITDGFHYTRPIDLFYRKPSYYYFNVVCAIDDLQLIGSFSMIILFYLLGFVTGVLVLKILSFLPIVYLLSIYYMDRKNFIQVRQDHFSGRNWRRG